jgi:GTPase SAR1 family protein
METSSDYVSYKKVLVFGSEGTGKTSFTKRLEQDLFEDESHTEEGKIKLIINILYKHLSQKEYRSTLRKINL